MAFVDDVRAGPVAPDGTAEFEVGVETVAELHQFVEEPWQDSLHDGHQARLGTELPGLDGTRTDEHDFVTAAPQGADQLLEVDELSVFGADSVVVQDLHAPAVPASFGSNSRGWLADLTIPHTAAQGRAATSYDSIRSVLQSQA